MEHEERRIGTDVLLERLDNIDKKVDKMQDGFEVFKKEWINYQIACAKDNLIERVKYLEDRPDRNLKGWETKLVIISIVVSLLLSAGSIVNSVFNARSIMKTSQEQKFTP